MPQPHETLVAWQRADDLAFEIYKLTKRFPAEERYGLTSQVRRSAFSVAANIVEGYAFSKSHSRMRFLRIAIASLAELGYALHFGKRVGYISEKEWGEVDLLVKKTAAPLHGLLKQQGSSLLSG